jgi:RNA polymerase sigma factor (sigma-70 family)
MKNVQAGPVLRHLREFVASEHSGRLPDALLLERFAADREQAAFEALVRRHGPLVMGVCRRLLPNPHDADDAFQATFWVLARKAGSVGKQGSLGGWLYRVAYHAALKARARAALRERLEREAPPRPSADPLAEVTGRELVATLDEELHRLPECYRTPLVLCYLEGKTRDEAARQLGWSLGTLKRRLEQGRDRLRRRLDRRGLALAAVLLAAGAGGGAVRAAVPPLLTSCTARTAVRFAGGQASAALSGEVLAEEIIGMLFPAPFKTAGAILGIVALAALATGALLNRGLDQRATNGPAQAGPQANAGSKKPAPDQAATAHGGPAEAKAGTMTVSGQVRDARGKPVPGARVAVVARPKQTGRGGDFAAERYRVLGQGRTDAAGRFCFRAGRSSLLRHRNVMAVAQAKGYSLGWQKLNADARQPRAALRLLPEEVITGRLIDLQGQPVVGVQVHVDYVGKNANGEFDGVSLYAGREGFPLWPAEVVTDTKGRFAMQGLNRALGVGLGIQDDRYAPQRLSVNPTGLAKEVTGSLSPATIIEGSVVYGDTGRTVPKARLTVYSHNEPYAGGGGMGGRADARGRFRLNPYAGKYFVVAAYAPDGEPYLALQKELTWPKGAVKQELKLALPRGVLIRGNVTDTASGKPVAGASVQYQPRVGKNPHYRKDVITGWQGIVVTGPDGTFRIAVLPGPGHLLVCGPTLDYVHQEIGNEVLYNNRAGGTRYYPDALVKLDLPAKVHSKDVAVTLRRGVTVKGTLMRPDGKPVEKALMMCRLHIAPWDLMWRFAQEVQGGRFELHGCDPKGSYPVYFLDAKNKLGASVTLSGKQAGESVTVRLVPCGRAKARFVSRAGKPWANIAPWLEIVITPGPHRFNRKAYQKGLLMADGDYLANIDRLNYWHAALTDAQGRITFPALIPGVTYRLVDMGDDNNTVTKDFRVEAGQTLDLGDVLLRRR